MDLTSTLAINASSALVKKIVGDIYDLCKARSTISIDLARLSLKERQIARLISKVTHVKTLWNIEREISLYDFYYPSQVEISTNVRKKIESIGAFGRTQNFVIQGTAGQGKSIFLRYLCGQELRPDISTNRIPIFVELRRIKSGETFFEFLLQTMGKYGLPPSADVFDACAANGKFVLLLDAFDEIDPALVQTTLGDIEDLVDKYQDSLQIIVTARPNSDIQNSSRFRVCRLDPLRPSDHLPFLKKVCTEKKQADDMHKVIEKSASEVRQLLTTPLMLTLLVMLYKSIQTIPDTVPRFYGELFDVLFYRHDHSKLGFRRKRYTSLDDTKLKKLFSAFCFHIRLKSYSTINAVQLEECCLLANKAIGVNVDPLGFKQEIVKTACLMQEEGFELSFIHKSVAEYYAASFIASCSEEFARKFYGRIIASSLNWEMWSIELRFLQQIDEYRYAKYFVLESVADMERTTRLDLNSPLSEGDKLVLEGIFSSGIHVNLAGEQYIKLGVFISGWGFNGMSNYVMSNMRDIWMHHLRLGVNGASGIHQEIIDIATSSKKDRERCSIACSKMLMVIPLSIRTTALESALAFVERIKLEAEAIVRREDENTRLIEDLLSAGI